jgi:hypothetical protein
MRGSTARQVSILLKVLNNRILKTKSSSVVAPAP